MLLVGNFPINLVLIGFSAKYSRYLPNKIKA